jgi:hypothetical protein
MAITLPDFQIYRGDDVLIDFVMRTNGSIAGWTTKFTLRAHDTDADPVVLSADGQVTVTGSPSTPGVISVTLSKAQTLARAKGVYAYSLKRVDTGAADTLRKGRMYVELDVLNQAS